MDWFWWLYLVLIGGGLLGSLYFVVTAWRGIARRMTLESFDAGGWVAALIVAFGLALYNFYDLKVYKAPRPDTVFRLFQVIFLYSLIDAVILARLVMWKRIRRQRREKGEGEDQ